MSTVDTSRLSAECALARQDGYTDMHTWCRRTQDVPLPHSKGLLLVPRCIRPCHKSQGDR